jgi:predicted DCC family thiol-disulfide oxidoreductase YuxK
VAAIDSRDIFEIEPLQGGAGQEMLRRHGMNCQNFDTMVVEVGGRAHLKSDAVLEIFRQIGGVWRIAEVGRIIPREVRDRLYMFVSRNRLRLFGRAEACPVPTEALRRKFARAEARDALAG